ncbi:MAG: hypothetical protein ACJ79K_15260 [Gemmatimonadaceae bacterium]
MTSTSRRIRGAFGLALTWGVIWAIAAAITGAPIATGVLWARGYHAPFGLLTIAFALAGGISGFVSGAGFALLLTTSARRKTLDELNPLKFGLLGALPAAVFGLLLFREAGLALVSTTFGFVAATGSLILARRANDRELDEPPRLRQLPHLE